MENPIKMDDLGVPKFLKTPICFTGSVLGGWFTSFTSYLRKSEKKLSPNWPFFGGSTSLWRLAVAATSLWLEVSAKRRRQTCINTVNWSSWDRIFSWKNSALWPSSALTASSSALLLGSREWICRHVAVDKIGCNVQAASDSQTHPRIFVYRFTRVSLAYLGISIYL